MCNKYAIVVHLGRLCKLVQIPQVVECPLWERDFGRAIALGAGGRRFETWLCRVGGLKLLAVLSNGFNWLYLPWSITGQNGQLEILTSDVFAFVVV